MLFQVLPTFPYDFPVSERERMKQISKDPFEAAFEEEEDDSAAVAVDAQQQDPDEDEDYDGLGMGTGTGTGIHSSAADPSVSASTSAPASTATTAAVSAAKSNAKNKYDDQEEEEEDNMDVELSKLPPTADPVKMAKMQAILSQFTEQQMSRYESFRRAGFQKSNMKRLLASITGTPKISVPMTIVVSGIAKMFVGELVETARMVMAERKESGPIRPCHIREAYRRLKLEGKVPKRSVPRLFR
ncbi:transcription initiation factor TFIID subunit 11 [Juglans microcarpa x Juglans regia]|uniref:transcription initiation factor TFIID subunit 11 n=1 Tax=Juglans microcarpa x Juglans regia TaxID=2249226 RepID=UPI001B7E36D4|nr:transcription initiation factor TFIID subunit 11 [Juglans microcarpa x Juglans regia]XP_041027401.1 transcription initiation factor TFIID subunit 11 [Juglans microcarpa x Juglans regia]